MRLDGLVPQENILVLTNHQQLDAVRAVLKNFPQENCLCSRPLIRVTDGWSNAGI